MSSQGERRVLGFDEWFGEVERRKPKKLFVKIKGVKNVMYGEVYDYEPWFMDGRTEVLGYLPTQSRPKMDMIHQRLTKLGYTVYGFGEDGSVVIVRYRRGGEGEDLRIYRIEVDEEKCPHCGWRVSAVYVVASSESEAKNLMENGMWLCGNCMADTLVDRDYILKSGKRVGGHPHTPRMR